VVDVDRAREVIEEHEAEGDVPYRPQFGGEYA
jgi:hypothetical protein